jgi:hypothetical protein
MPWSRRHRHVEAAFSPPPSNPAANARLASHSSRSNSREFALASIVWM